MALTKEVKEQIIKEFQLKEGDTGSVEVQVAILTKDISLLTEHFKVHKHDYHSQRGLFKKIAKRRNLLSYLKDEDFDRYQALIQKLGLRR